jgi:hypothetical protein
MSSMTCGTQLARQFLEPLDLVRADVNSIYCCFSPSIILSVAALTFLPYSSLPPFSYHL